MGAAIRSRAAGLALTVGAALSLGAALTVGAALASPGLVAQVPERLTYESAHMGTTFRIVAFATDRAATDRAAEDAFGHIARLDSLFSDYRVDSEIARLASHAGERAFVRVSPELWSVLETAQGWARITDGAFDITIGPITRLWRWSARRGEAPDPARLAATRTLVGHHDLTVDSATRGVRLDRPGMSLDLGAIAKGYAADAALRTLADHGVRSAFVDAGGDLALGAPPPGRSGWLVALPSGETVLLARTAIATSGDARRFVTLEGDRHSHVVNPRTGLGAIEAPTVTVVAPSATTADVLASALTVMDRDSGMALVESLAGVWVSVVGTSSWTSGPRPEHPTSHNESEES